MLENESLNEKQMQRLRKHRNALLEVALSTLAEALEVHREFIDDAMRARRIGDAFSLGADIDFLAQQALTKTKEALVHARRQVAMINKDPTVVKYDT